MIHELHEMLARARSRMRSVRTRTALAACWLVWASVGWGAWKLAPEYNVSGPLVAIFIATAAAITAIGCVWAILRSTSSPHWVARRIEAKHPELGAALLAALEQAPSPRFRRLGYLQSSVIRRAVHHGREHNWARDVPIAHVGLAQVAHLCTFALLVASCVVLFRHKDASARSTLARDISGLSPGTLQGVEIEPGDTEIERGTTLLVVAQFGDRIPDTASLIVETMNDANEDGEGRSVRPMTRSLDDPKFVARVPAVTSDLAYSVDYGYGQSETFRAKVFDYPALERTDARLEYPEYTSLEPKVVEDVRNVTAVEGTKLTLQCRLNKHVSQARLVDRNGEELLLAAAGKGVPVYSATWTLVESRRFKLHLVDADGRANKFPPELVVNVTPNRPASIKLARPARDVRVSAIEELQVAADVSDDFALQCYGLSYFLGGDEPAEVVLYDQESAEEPAAVQKAELSHLLDLESLDVEPDQLLSYYVWAEDIGPDGHPRRTMSDMYFAEVRHFEEIFRQGEQLTEQQSRESQQQQGQQAGGQQAEELAELQKQIVNATWSLIRRERAGSPSDDFGDDVKVISDSQQQALTKLDELQGEIADEESLGYAEKARQEMEKVLEHLTGVARDLTVDGLRPALAREQAAYQTLLKLRAREFNVSQRDSQQQGPASGSASGAGSRSQQQLNELELSADENRYETQSRALDSRQQSDPGQDEAREMLDRLRELARRQQDLNERVRELQSQLEAAENEKQREEIERELKRLRDQQREVLRDTDELRSEVQNSENADQMQEATEQLEETRSRVQQASEALEEGRLSEAVTEGTRAGRQLNELRDDFRRRAADRFSQEMRDLRESARQLDERQQQLSENLAEQQERQNRSLRDTGAREEVLEGLKEQRQQYEELLEQMQQTVQEAEEPEPLLARQLYDTVQEATGDQIGEALEVTQELLDVGVTREAAETMRAANRGVDRLRQNVNRAAESVLGDETEALRRAEQELNDLAEELNREIQRAQGEQSVAEEQSGSAPPDQTGRPNDQNRGDGEAAPNQEPSEPGTSSDRQPNRSDELSNQGSEPTEQQSSERSDPGNLEEPSSEQQPTPGAGSPRTEETAEQPEDRTGGLRPAESDDENDSNRNSPRRGGGLRGGGDDRAADDFAEFFEGLTSPGGPITGDDFREWNDRMRDVQDLLDDPDLRAEVARIRDRAEQARIDYRRNSEEPDWNNLIKMVAEPLGEVRQRISEEIRRKQSPDALVPIDRDPVPAEHVQKVRLYYERLGSGE